MTHLVTDHPAAVVVYAHDFGWALTKLRGGAQVYRRGWNGRGMWLLLVPETAMEEMSDYLAREPFKVEARKFPPWIGMMTATREFLPWGASQTDLLAEDWESV